MLEGVDGRRLAPVEEVMVLTGFRPDLSFLSEVRLDLDAVLQASRGLAPMIDPACTRAAPCIRTMRGTGAARDRVYLVSMKSYVRAPTFLTLTGY